MAFLRVTIEDSWINDISLKQERGERTILVDENFISIVAGNYIVVDGCKFNVGEEKAKAIEKWLTRNPIDKMAESKNVFELMIEHEATDATYYVG